MGLLQLADAQPKVVGDSGTRIAGTLYLTNIDASGTVAANALTQNSQAVLDASTSFGGDVSGSYSALTVAKIQGNAVLSGTPNDGDVLTWVNSNSRWEPVAPSGGSTYYTVLDATATHTAINTALSTYDVVYLEPGNYSNVTAQIVVPANKQLIGLCGKGRLNSSADAPYMSFVTTGGGGFSLGINSLVEGIIFRFGASSAGPAIYAASGGARVRWCKIWGEAAGTAYNSLLGGYKEISHVYSYYCFGISISVLTGFDGGPNFVEYVTTIGHPSNTTSSNVGLACGQPGYKFSNCWFEGGLYGIRLTSGAVDSQLSNIYCDSQTLGNGIGIYLTVDRVVVSNCYVFGTNLGNQVGVWATGDYCSFSNIYVYNTASYGFYLTGNYTTGGGLYAWDCGDLGTDPGFYIASDYSSFGVMASHGSGSYGFQIQASLGCSFASLEARQNSDSGVYVASSNNFQIGTILAMSNGQDGVEVLSSSYATISSVTANSNSGNGVNVGANQNGLHFVSGSTYGNTGTGFLAGNSGVTQPCRITSWYSFGNSVADITLGSTWYNYATPGGIQDPGTKATNDILQYTGAAWDAKGAASGDRLTGTIYGTSLDMSTQIKTLQFLAEGGGGEQSSLYGTHLSFWDHGASPPSASEGDVWYDDAGLNFYDGTRTGTLPVSSRVRAYLSSDQLIGNGNPYQVQLDAETFDSLSEYDNATNYRFTPTKTGYYLVHAQILWEYASSLDFWLWIFKTGAAVTTNTIISTSVGSDFHQQVSDVIYLTTSDYIEIYAQQNTVGNLNIRGGSDDTFVAIHRLV